MAGFLPFQVEGMPEPVTVETRAQNFQESKVLSSKYLGALRGQIVKGYGSWGNPSDYSWRDIGLEFPRSQMYEIVWQITDTIDNKWVVVSLEPVGTDNVPDFSHCQLEKPDSAWRQYSFLVKA